MKRGTSYDYENDVFSGARVLVLRKERGRLSLQEIQEILQYEGGGIFNGRYALLINATESTIGGTGWNDGTDPVGDIVELYELETNGNCPVCAKLLPDPEYCPACGEHLKNSEVGG